MPQVKHDHDGTWIYWDATDTYLWATRPGEAWPCSVARSRKLYVQLDSNGDLVDYDLLDDYGTATDDDGERIEMPADEMTAIINDTLPPEHVGQRPIP